MDKSKENSLSEAAALSVSDIRSGIDAREFNVRSLLALVGAWCALFCTLGFQNAFGVFQEYYSTTILRSHSQFDIAWIGSIMTFMLFIFGGLAGFLIDRVGPTPLLAIGSIGTCIAHFMTSLCTKYYQFLLAQGVLLGASNAFLAFPAMVTITHLFNKYGGTTTGITISGSSVGGIVWPIMLNRLLNYDNVSFGWTFRIVAFVVFALCILMLLTIRLPPGNAPDSLATTGKHSESENETQEESTPNVTTLKSPAFITLCVGLCVATLGLFAPIFFISTYGAANGLSTSLCFYLLSILNGASLIGRVSTGIMADKYGNFNICFLTVLFCGIVGMCWTRATSTAGIIAFTLAYGYTSGAMFSIQSPCAVQLSPPKSRGKAIGILMLGPSIPGLISPPISGHLVAQGYLALSMYTGAALLAGAVLILYSRLHQTSKLFVKV